MMKKALIPLVIIAVLASCSPMPTVTVQPTRFDCPAEGGEFEVKVHSNFPWKSKLQDEETSLDPETGSNGDKVAITVIPNKDGIEKNLVIYFTASNGKEYSIANVLIVQESNTPLIKVTNSSPELDFKGGNISMQLESNAPWTVAVTPAGPEIKPTSGIKGKTAVDVIFPANFTRKDIEYAFDFECTSMGESTTTTINVLQTKAPEAAATFFPATQDIPASGGSFDLKIESNYPWTAGTGEGVTLSKAEGLPKDNISVEVAANTSGQPVHHEIRFTFGSGEIARTYVYSIEQQ